MSRFKDGLAGHLAVMSLGAKVNDNASVIGVTVANLRTQLDELKSELKADEDGLVQMRAILLRVRLVKKTHEQRLRKLKASAALFDKSIGPLANVYETAIEASGLLYDMAKAKHAKGVAVLKDKFGFHELYSKGRPGEFRGREWPGRDGGTPRRSRRTRSAEKNSLRISASPHQNPSTPSDASRRSRHRNVARIY